MTIMNARSNTILITLILLLSAVCFVYTDATLDCTGVQTEATINIYVYEDTHSVTLPFEITPQDATHDIDSNIEFSITPPRQGTEETLTEQPGDPITWTWDDGVSEPSVSVSRAQSSTSSDYTLQIEQLPAATGELPKGLWVFKISNLIPKAIISSSVNSVGDQIIVKSPTVGGNISSSPITDGTDSPVQIINARFKKYSDNTQFGMYDYAKSSFYTSTTTDGSNHSISMNIHAPGSTSGDIHKVFLYFEIEHGTGSAIFYNNAKLTITLPGVWNGAQLDPFTRTESLLSSSWVNVDTHEGQSHGKIINLICSNEAASDNRKYYITATIKPEADTNSDLVIDEEWNVTVTGLACSATCRGLIFSSGDNTPTNRSVNQAALTPNPQIAALITPLTDNIHDTHISFDVEAEVFDAATSSIASLNNISEEFDVNSTVSATTTYNWNSGADNFGIATINVDDRWKVVTVRFTATASDATLKHTAEVDIQIEAPDIYAAAPSTLTADIGKSAYETIELTNLYGGAFTVSSAAVSAYDSDDKGYYAITFTNDIPGTLNEAYYQSLDFYQDFSELDLDPVQISNPLYMHVRYIPYETGDTDKTITLDLVNAPDHTDYKIALEGSGGGAPTSRDPFNFVTVFDKSGSMRGNTHCSEGTSSVKKIKGLHNHASLFYAIMDAVKQDSDQFAAVEYNSTAQINVVPGTSSYGGNLHIGTASEDKIVGAIDAVNALNAGGATSITRALELALQEMKDADNLGNPDVKKAILLLTDGIHNTPTWDYDSGFYQDFDAMMTAATPPVTTGQLANIRLYVVGLGAGGNLNVDMLKNIVIESFGPIGAAGNEYSFADDGGYRHTCSPGLLGIYFAQILVDNLSESDEIVEDDPGTVKEGEIFIETIPVNSSAERAIFYLTWQEPDINLYFKLEAPDGTEINPGPSITKKGYALYTLNFPYYTATETAVKHSGDWKMYVMTNPEQLSQPISDLSEPEESGETSDVKTIHYEAALIIKDPVISTDFNIEGDHHFAGDDILLTATLKEAGTPILHADDVKVIVDVPGVGLGDFIFNNNVSPDTQVQMAESGADDSPATLKLEALLMENPDGLKRVSLILPMRDDGEEGDAQANDGIYTLYLRTGGGESQTENNGVYSYKFKAGGETLAGERFERTKTISDYIASLPDPGESAVNYHYQDPKTAHITVTLRDKKKHFVDPINTRYTHIYPKKPDPSSPRAADNQDAVNFRISTVDDPLKGTVTYTLQATSGQFKPYMKVEDFIGLDVVGLGMPKVSIEPKLFQWPFYAEAFGGYFQYDSALSLDNSCVFGAKIGWNLFTFWSIEGEFGWSPTKDSSSTKGNVFQYGANVTYTPPILYNQLRPFIIGGFGAASFLGFNNEDTSLAANLGIGLKYYPHWKKRFGIILTLRDIFIFDAFGTGLTNSFQITAGLRLNF